MPRKSFDNLVGIALYFFFFCFRGVLGEASTGVSAFADSLEEFGAGHDDPVSVSIGGCGFIFILFSPLSN